MSAIERAAAAVYAVDLPRMAAFYVAVAGMREAEAEDGFVRLLSPVLELVIVRAAAEVVESVTITDPPERREQTPIKLGFLVESIATARATAPGFGGVVDEVENEWEWQGLRRCDGHDPEGNVVQMLERVS